MGLRVREIALYQTVKIPLYANGRWLATRETPIVQGKRALVRVFVEPFGDGAPTKRRAELRIRTLGRTTTLVDQRQLTQRSSDEDLASTFTMTIPAALIGEDTSLSVALEQLACELPDAGAVAENAALADGVTLAAEVVGPLRAVVVPIRMGDRLPQLEQTQVARIRAVLRATHPAAEVELTVHEPVDAPPSVPVLDPLSTTHQIDLLQSVLNLREREAPAPDVYYLALVKPADSSSAHCQNGCVMGIAPRIERPTPNSQAAVSVYFDDEASYEEIVHGLGHLHGLRHTACDGGFVLGVDTDYPGRDGHLDQWGWDARVQALRAPSDFRDVMGHCEPRWISGYSYRAMLRRAQEVRLAKLVVGAVSARYRSVLVGANGHARWGASLETTLADRATEAATVLDESGAEIARIDLAVVPIADAASALVYLPEPGAHWSTIVWSTGRLQLASVLPPNE